MFGRKKQRGEFMVEVLGNIGKAIGNLIADEEKRGESNREVLLDLVKKSQTYDDLSQVIAKYGDDNSTALTLALILQAANLRFKSLEEQVNILQSEIIMLKNTH